MKHTSPLRRVLPLCAALALLLSLPASAFLFWGSGTEEESSVTVMAKNTLTPQTITFSADDFRVSGSAGLDSIVITALPDSRAGVLTLSSTALAVGDVVAADALSGITFRPVLAPTLDATAFSFTPVFSDGSSGETVEVPLYLLSEQNGAPIAENLELTTYKNVALTARFAATDPEGDLITFQLIKKPARGAVTMPEEGSSEFVYTPYENKTGKDSFTYVAVDAVGNASEPVTVKIQILKPDTKVTYADMDGNAAHKAAIRLAEEGIFVGACMGGEYFFSPDTPVSRSEFVAMAMKVAGLEALEDISVTGFADDVAIPTWAKGYASSALKAGLVQGTIGSDGQVIFDPDSTITRAQATVLLDRALQISDVAVDDAWAESASVPTWAAQSAANLSSCGLLRSDASGSLGMSVQLTRAQAAQMLCDALELLDSRESESWLPW